MNKKTKRIAIATLLLTAIGVWIAYNQHQLDVEKHELEVQSTQASIDYSLEKRSNYYTLDDNTITFRCNNAGEMDGHFYMVMTFINASFSTQTELPYTQVNNGLVKFHYLVHKSELYNKSVYFNIDEDVESFSLSLTLEKIDQNPLKANPRYPCYLYYEWNEQLQSFELIE